MNPTPPEPWSVSCDALSEPVEVPAAWTPFVSVQNGRVDVAGDDAGQLEIGLIHHGDTLHVVPGVERYTQTAKQAGCAVSPRSVSFGLHDAFIPAPWGAFADTHLLGVGDRVTLRPDGNHGSGWHAETAVDFPYLSAKSRQDQPAEPGRLLDAMCASLSRLLGDQTGVLMLSAGKDSTTIALAAAEAALSDRVRCLTFVAGTDQDEDAIVAKHAEQLGLAHRALRLPDDPATVRRVMTAFFERSPAPCMDVCTPAYAAALAEADAAGGVVIDGMGNDIYIGHCPSVADRTKRKYTFGRNALTKTVQRFVDHASKLNFFCQTPAELQSPGYYYRLQESRTFYPDVVPTTPFWDELEADTKHLDLFDQRGLVRGRHYDQREAVLKARVAAASVGARAVLPWADADLIDFVFHLPEAERFDRENVVNKVIVRKLLRERMGYDDAAIGKRGFQFDTAGFVRRHADFVRDTILGCPLLTPAIRDRFDRELMRSDRPEYATALMTTFLLSGWLNHHAA